MQGLVMSPIKKWDPDFYHSLYLSIFFAPFLCITCSVKAKFKADFKEAPL